MRCELCTTGEHRRVGMAEELDIVPQAATGEPVCVRCGRSLAAGAGERLIHKLTQLGRFGLAGPPLLARRRAAL